MIQIIILLLVLSFVNYKYTEGLDEPRIPDKKIVGLKKVKDKQFRPPKSTDPIKPNCECFDNITKTKLFENNLMISYNRNNINRLKKEAHQSAKDLDLIDQKIKYIKKNLG